MRAFKQDGVIYRDTNCGFYYYYSKKRGDYIGFDFAACAKLMMRSQDAHCPSWFGAKPEEIEPYLVPLTFAQQAAIITDGL